MKWWECEAQEEFRKCNGKVEDWIDRRDKLYFHDVFMGVVENDREHGGRLGCFRHYV